MSFPIVDRGSMGARHTTAASSGALTLASAALNTRGFVADVLDDADVARQRVLAMIPEGADVFTAASETLRLSGIDAELNDSARYKSVRNRTSSMDRAAQASEIRRHMATPEFAIGSVAAVTVDGTLVVVSAIGARCNARRRGSSRQSPDGAACLLRNRARRGRHTRGANAYGRNRRRHVIVAIRAARDVATCQLSAH